MNHEIRSERLAESLRHLSHHWESRRRAAAGDSGTLRGQNAVSTIAISREAGTPGTSVAREIGKRLAWQVYDNELLEKIAENMGLRSALLECVDERHQSWLLEAAQAFLSAPVQGDWGPLVTESAYVHHLVKVVLALGALGDCVIVGRGSAFILPSGSTFRLRLVAPVRKRISALSHNFGIPEREAALKVRATDRERNDFVQDHFHKDPTDAQNYDLVVNVARFSIERCADLVVEAFRQLQDNHPDSGHGEPRATAQSAH
jgi:cytidylate kinase